MFFKEKIIYTDVLEEWRKVKIWDFYLFDKVLVWDSKKPYVIIWNSNESIYKNTFLTWYSKLLKHWNPELLRWWELKDEWASYESIKYLCYKLVDTQWKESASYEVKKYYWEFQQEFESLDKAVRDEQELKKKVLEIQQLEKSMNENYEKARKIQGKNYKELWII